MVDTLVGLKENVILGHLIPAGTAFNPHLNLKIRHLAEPPVALGKSRRFRHPFVPAGSEPPLPLPRPQPPKPSADRLERSSTSAFLHHQAPRQPVHAGLLFLRTGDAASNRGELQDDIGWLWSHAFEDSTISRRRPLKSAHGHGWF